MLDVTGFNEYNIKLDGVIGNDTGHIQNRGGGLSGELSRLRKSIF